MTAPAPYEPCAHDLHPGENTDEKVDRVLAELADIRKTLDESKTVIEKVAGEVKPVLDSLMKNSMLKMLLGGK